MAAKKEAAPAAVDGQSTESATAAAEGEQPAIEPASGEPGEASSVGDLQAEGGASAEPVEGVTVADVAALFGVPAELVEEKPVEARLYVNEGMRTEIEQHGFTHDPSTGHKITAEDLHGVVRGY